MWFIKIKKAFSLSELLVVIMVLGILAGVAMPKFKRVLDSRKTEEAENMLKAARIEQELRCMSGKNYLGEGNLGKLETLANASQSKNYIYSLQPTGISAAAIGSDYTLKMISYKTGTICCEGDGCSALNKNYLLCNSLEPVQDECTLEPVQDESTFDSAYGGPSGWQSCDTYPCTKECDRAVKAGYTCTGTYNEDHTYKELVCQGDVCVITNYKEDDKQIVRESCLKSGNMCVGRVVNTYDENGRLLSTISCSTRNAAGECTGYSTGYEYTYDENGNKISQWRCTGHTEAGECIKGEGTVYIYDENGHEIFHRACKQFNDDGSCGTYQGVKHESMYDEHGNRVTYRICGGVSADGSCWMYNTISDYTYDENGNITSTRNCNNVATSSCSNYTKRTDYTYDEKGNQTSERSCSEFNADGSCSSYTDGREYTYDSNGNQTSVTGCKEYNADGSCSSYNYRTDYMYDDNGNQIWKRPCSGVNADGSCSGYTSFAAYDYAYDGDGNQIAQRSCLAFNASGECTSYESGYADQTLNDEQGNEIARRSCSVWSGTTCTSWGSWNFLILNGR